MSAPALTPPPASHAQKVARWLLRGTGVEIGAGGKPLPGIQPFYVDRFATFAGQPTGAEFQGDATALPFRDHSLDFVASSHVLEHLANPVAAFVEWVRVLRHRGIIYLVVPDRRFTWDRLREPTPVEHLLADFAAGTTACDPTHIDEFVERLDLARIESPPPAAEWPAFRARLRAELHETVRRGDEIDLHFHVFEPANVLALIDALRTSERTRFDWRVVDQAEGFPADCPNGFFVALEVRQPPAARFAGWRHRRLTRHNPRHPVLASAVSFPTKERPLPSMTETATDPASLARQLDQVARREAGFRLKTIQTFRELDQRLRQASERADALSLELGARNTYIHALHQERAEWRRAVQQVHGDVEVFSAWLQAAEDERQALRAELARVKASWNWRSGAWLRQLQRWFGAAPARPAPPAPTAVAPGTFVYYFHTSPFRVYREKDYTLRGWVIPVPAATPGAVTAVRAWVDDAEFIGRGGREEPEVVAQHGLADGPHARPGFEITIQTPPGRHHLRVEAQLDHRAWRTFLSTPIWAQP